jgi:hypothetical protein
MLAVAIMFAATFVSAFYTLIVGLGGAPGAFIATRDQNGGVTFWTGFGLTVMGQLYACLAWATFIIGSMENYLASHPGYIGWVLWIAAFFAAAAPAHWAVKDAFNNENPTIQHATAGWTAALADIAFFVLLFLPSIRHLFFGWVPTLFR